MIRLFLLCAIGVFICLGLNALQIVDTGGISHEFSNEDLHKHETMELKTSREKDGQIRLNNWLGFRFDIWLIQQDLGEFSTIRFESADRYLVSLSRAEFEAMESWLVTAQDEVPFEDFALRLIIPSLREMNWIRDLKRVVLEDFKPLQRPWRFYLMQTFLQGSKLHNEPAPFVNIQGYFFKEFLPRLSESENFQVILYSRDGLKQNLEFPLHLEGAVLEKTEQATYDLKSPQIPGGMWVKDIIYLQCDGQALIDQASLNSLITLAKLFGWEQGPELSFRILKTSGEEVFSFGDALAEPQVFEGALYFELF